MHLSQLMITFQILPRTYPLIKPTFASVNDIHGLVTEYPIQLRKSMGLERRLWGNITQAEEDKALAVIRRRREDEPNFMRGEVLRREAA